MSKKLYHITVSGCDGETEVDLELTNNEAQTIVRLAEAVTAASTYGCEPRMCIEPAEVTP